MTEEEKMLAGQLYDPSDPKLQARLHYAHRLSQEYNQTFDDETAKREEILSNLIPDHGVGTYLQGPIFFDYGCYTHLGQHFYANANFTVLDCGHVTIGDSVWFGPNITLVTPMHPTRNGTSGHTLMARCLTSNTRSRLRLVTIAGLAATSR